MTNKSKRLQLLVALHERREQEALLAMGRSEQKLLEQMTQLGNLQKYRQEYDVNQAERQKSAMSIDRFLESRAFVEKLDKAIVGQQSAVTAQEQDLRMARSSWEESRQRTKSLRKLSERALAEGIKIESKREQLEQDDRAARSSK